KRPARRRGGHRVGGSVPAGRRPVDLQHRGGGGRGGRVCFRKLRAPFARRARAGGKRARLRQGAGRTPRGRTQLSRSRRGAIVAGVLGGKPANGGHAWSRVSFVVGLRRLGFDVAFVEQGAEISNAEREHFERVCAQFDIDG